MSTTISRQVMVNTISEKIRADHETVEDAMEALERIVIDALGNEKCVKLNGFGTFSLRHRSVRYGGAVELKSERREENIINFRPSASLVAVHE